MGGLDKTLQVWEAASGQQLLKQALDAKNPNIQPVAFSRDGQILVTRGQTLQFWETATGKELGQITPPAGRLSFNWVAFSPSGSILATTGFDATTQLWEVPGGKLLRKLGEAKDPKVRPFAPLPTFARSFRVTASC
jgi:WD40 repeat protein